MLIAEIPQAYLAAFVLQIAAMLMDGAGGDVAEARKAAGRMLSSYEPRNDTELRLAARIIGFNLQAGAALAQAADPATPLSRVIRLRSGAVAMSREAEKAERRLEKLRAEAVTAPAEAPLPEAAPTPKPKPSAAHPPASYPPASYPPSGTWHADAANEAAALAMARRLLSSNATGQPGWEPPGPAHRPGIAQAAI